MTALWPSLAAFRVHLCAQGIELHLKSNGGLHIWPSGAKPHLTDAERDYLYAHRPELRELVRTTGLRETTVEWQAPGADIAEPPAEAAPREPESEPVCDYCHQT